MTRRGTAFTTSDIETIKSRFPWDDLKLLSTDMGRSVSSIRQKAQQLDIRRRMYHTAKRIQREGHQHI